eukprot:TRINITY_DN2290_c0_g1_i3.p1 TRINITY_DN2290_c0_g1~~TRINITY_DN2290_c0_g1_i3.p1  ORF type:complete len:234 (+),score=52.75 TRINITY_DN2290_c0_g1_i3:41-742(+)
MAFTCPTARALVASVLISCAQAELPNPGEIIGKLACKALTNEEAKEQWSRAFCDIGPIPDSSFEECIRQVEAVWAKAAAKCPSQEVADDHDDPVAFPNPGEIIGKLACKTLTNEEAKKQWSRAFCDIGPIPDSSFEECIRQVEAVWAKAAAKCPSQEVADDHDDPVAFPNPGEIIGKLACKTLTNEEAKKQWSRAFCDIGPIPDGSFEECRQQVEAFWAKAAAKCPSAQVVLV